MTFMLKTLPLTVTRQVVHTGARAYHRAIEGSVLDQSPCHCIQIYSKALLRSQIVLAWLACVESTYHSRIFYPLFLVSLSRAGAYPHLLFLGRTRNFNNHHIRARVIKLHVRFASKTESRKRLAITLASLHLAYCQAWF
jgi:hypothetical protein